MVISGVPKEKDLQGGSTDPSPHVGGAVAPNDWGINGHSPIPRPLVGRTTYSRTNCDVLDLIVRPTRGRMVGVGRF